MLDGRLIRGNGAGVSAIQRATKQFLKVSAFASDRDRRGPRLATSPRSAAPLAAASCRAPRASEASRLPGAPPPACGRATVVPVAPAAPDLLLKRLYRYTVWQSRCQRAAGHRPLNNFALTAHTAALAVAGSGTWRRARICAHRLAVARGERRARSVARSGQSTRAAATTRPRASCPNCPTCSEHTSPRECSPSIAPAGAPEPTPREVTARSPARGVSVPRGAVCAGNWRSRARSAARLSAPAAARPDRPRARRRFVPARSPCVGANAAAR